MALPSQDELQQVLAEAKHVERRARLLKQLVARTITNLQSEEDTRNGSDKDTVEKG